MLDLYDFAVGGGDATAVNCATTTTPQVERQVDGGPSEEIDSDTDLVVSAVREWSMLNEQDGEGPTETCHSSGE